MCPSPILSPLNLRNRCFQCSQAVLFSTVIQVALSAGSHWLVAAGRSTPVVDICALGCTLQTLPCCCSLMLIQLTQYIPPLEECVLWLVLLCTGQRPGSKGMRHKYEAQQPRDAAWQGFRTKGAGKSARAGAGKAPRRSANLSEPKGSGARSASPKDRAFHKSGGSRAGSKRPAVQARKAAQSAPGNI